MDDITKLYVYMFEFFLFLLSLNYNFTQKVVFLMLIITIFNVFATISKLQKGGEC